MPGRYSVIVRDREGIVEPDDLAQSFDQRAGKHAHTTSSSAHVPSGKVARAGESVTQDDGAGESYQGTSPADQLNAALGRTITVALEERDRRLVEILLRGRRKVVDNLGDAQQSSPLGVHVDNHHLGRPSRARQLTPLLVGSIAHGDDLVSEAHPSSPSVGTNGAGIAEGSATTVGAAGDATPSGVAWAAPVPAAAHVGRAGHTLRPSRPTSVLARLLRRARRAAR